MSRPDWGALQQEYIAEYTRSGISPVTGSVYRNHFLSCQQTALHCLNPIYSLR